MFGLEVAMDELAIACAVDPIALRVRNEPQVDPETGQSHAFRHVLDCLQLGAGDSTGTSRPGAAGRLQHGWWTGMGVASATYRTGTRRRRPHCFEADGTYIVQMRRPRSVLEVGPR